MAVVTMRQLLESGVHFGHQTRRWNPKMKRFILTERNGIYIVDLESTLHHIDRAYSFVKETVARGGTVLFVGTKKQAQEPVAEQAARVGMPYVNQRWLGGMLTNFATVNKRLQRLKELEEIDFDDVAGSGFTKKELLIMRREKDKLAKTLGGIRDMAKVPSAVWIVDTNKEHLAVDEARKLGVPVVAILDTNCDPDLVDYAIPGNDDAIRAVTLLTRVVADAVAEGLIARHSARTAAAEGETTAEAEPLAEWERELLAGAGDAAAQTEPSAPATAADDTAAAPAATDPIEAIGTDTATATAPGAQPAGAEAAPASEAQPETVEPAPADDATPATQAPDAEAEPTES
ncbi:30S ribosomal protein S2 [Isoptericola sp. b441]|uniref:Small ribosomal subunit protein uS2 n=1 Tax=Actinotalea lenta TaxID=3064654 RepID=A0ABT9D8W3_9CELL|nr:MULTISPECIES: 30S ribosomal protein S2 [unclassified Isoptericola]MDO8107340.1 30S ribosomal protein S2 [Isoptericola sp. b441]MDO8120997.1 30S ribosomal protein S2 [Isoptericola sp. b490]